MLWLLDTIVGIMDALFWVVNMKQMSVFGSSIDFNRALHADVVNRLMS